MYTNHHTLKYFCTQPDPQVRQGRWAKLMQEFHMEILYHKGQDNVVVDALSRVMYTMSFTLLDNSLLQEIKEAQEEDPYAHQVMSKLKSCIDIGEGFSLSISSLTPSSSLYANCLVDNGWH